MEAVLGGRVVCGDDRKVDRIKENLMWSRYKFLAGPSGDLSRFRPSAIKYNIDAWFLLQTNKAFSNKRS